MNNEWRDLPTMADVAAAQAAGDEIELAVGSGWYEWYGRTWDIGWKFRARSVPKTKKVKILGWVHPIHGKTITRTQEMSPFDWIRYPKLDDEVEVPQ